MEGGPNIQEADNLTSSSDEENMSNTCYYSCFDPRGKCHRFIALFFMCFLGFGSYFCYDNPAALQDYFMNDLNMTTPQFVMLYSLYSWPNVFLCFVGGFLLDSVFGIGLGTNIYMFLTLLGQVIFATGTITNQFWMMAAGRFIFGTGGESLAVAQNNYAVLWFKGKELNMVFGLQLSLARMGSTVNFWIMEYIYKWVALYYSGYECLGIVLFIAGLSCIISMFCSLFLGCMDKRADRILRRTETASQEVASLTCVKEFPSAFWLVAIIITAYYVTIFPFIALGKQFFIDKFNLTPQEANNVNSIIYLMSGIASPFLGYLIDRAGRNLSFVILSIVMTAAAHSMLIFTPWNPYVGMVTMGIAYSLLASGLWPLVALLVPEYQLGTAYGICQAVQNLGLAVISIITGLIVHHFSYFWLEIFFLGWLTIAFTATIFVWIWNIKHKGTLNMTPKAREEREMYLTTNRDRERLLKESGEEGEGSGDTMQPSSDIQIRNRYLQKIGTPLPKSLKSSYYKNMVHTKLI